VNVRTYRRSNKYGDGHDGPLTIAAYTRDVHVFVFKFGVAVRVRIGDDWRHFAIRGQSKRFDVGPGLGHASIMVETWQTRGGTTTRVPLSKKYVALKILG